MKITPALICEAAGQVTLDLPSVMSTLPQTRIAQSHWIEWYLCPFPVSARLVGAQHGERGPIETHSPGQQFEGGRRAETEPKREREGDLKAVIGSSNVQCLITADRCKNCNMLEFFPDLFSIW